MSSERWKRVKELFTEAAELPASERESFVASQPPGDPELGAEVRRLLEFYDHRQAARTAAGSTDVTPTRFAILKANQPNPQTIAEGLNNRLCWMFEISAPKKVSGGVLEDSIALGDLPRRSRVQGASLRVPERDVQARPDGVFRSEGYGRGSEPPAEPADGAAAR